MVVLRGGEREPTGPIEQITYCSWPKRKGCSVGSPDCVCGGGVGGWGGGGGGCVVVGGGGCLVGGGGGLVSRDFRHIPAPSASATTSALPP